MKAVNLLPPELRSGTRRRSSAAGASPAPAGGIGPYLVLGALALCLVALATYVFAVNTVTDRQSELARVTAEQEETAARAAALKPYGDFQDMAVRRAETVSSLASLRFDWEQALRDVSHALPLTVTLSALDGSISTETGAASSPLRGAIPSPAITLKGCTASQSAVASMMSRLRGIRGATRVTLAKSERIGDANSSADAEAGPCGRGARPAFEVVVFFERSVDAAAASTPATSIAPAAAPATAAATPAAGGQPTQPAPATPIPTPAP